MSHPAEQLPSAAAAPTPPPPASISTAASPSSTSSPSSPPTTFSASYVTIERRADYAVLSIRREPVNSMNLDVWTQLLDGLTQLEGDRTCRGVILQSGLKKGQRRRPCRCTSSSTRCRCRIHHRRRQLRTLPTNRSLSLLSLRCVHSGQRHQRVRPKAAAPVDSGNARLCAPLPDLRGCVCCGRLYAPSSSRERFLRFWRAQTVFLSRLYRSRLVTVACIRGSCPAGGCITSLCCDWRVMSSDDSPTIGLNEVALGISVPKHWAAVMARTIGDRQAERLLLRGELVRVAEAKELGMVDEVVEKGRLMEVAEREMRARLRNPDAGRVVTKGHLREALALQWEREWEAEAEGGWAMLSDERIVRMLGQVLQRLSGGKKQPQPDKGGAGAATAAAGTGSSSSSSNNKVAAASSAQRQSAEQHKAKL